MGKVFYAISQVGLGKKFLALLPFLALGGATGWYGQVLFFLNDARQLGMPCPGGQVSQNLGWLESDETLNQVAQRYAERIAETGLISHQIDGTTPRERVEQAGYAYVRLSEIIYKGRSDDPLEAFGWWLGSPPHCAAIMNPAYRAVGIGFAREGRAWVILLAQPK